MEVEPGSNQVDGCWQKMDLKYSEETILRGPRQALVAGVEACPEHNALFLWRILCPLFWLGSEVSCWLLTTVVNNFALVCKALFMYS